MAHYDIFRQKLAIRFPSYGHALWEPSPGDLYPPVQIGDVGFICRGKFHRLFNALLPADHPSHQNFGVPEHHKPLQPKSPAHITSEALAPGNFCSTNVVETSRQGVFAPGPDFEQISYSCSKEQGAILSLPVPARSYDTIAQGDFGKWIVTHIDCWFAFTRTLGLGIQRMEDIVLVTGCHLTRSWANIAFLQGRGEARVSFGAQVTDVSNIEWCFPPEGRQRVALNFGPNGRNLPEDQCIFIRGFRVTRRLGIFPRLRAAAGPSQNPDPDEPELDMQLLNISADTDYQDPLHKLLEYIAMKASDCDMILVHDDDLMRIDNAAPSETLQPNTVMGRPQRAMPEVWQVQCGGSEAKTPMLKVGTFSKNPFGTPADVSQPLAAPASHLPPPSDKAGVSSPPPTDMHADRDPIGPFTTPFGEPGPSSHTPWCDDNKAQPMKQTKPSANTQKYGPVPGIFLTLGVT
ncbi:hypothetical protein BC826DRAFT_970762 [Russula brevipes]|nr:hypothetical protein BC826DRAFT_970762 [Russula brevipes]